MLSAESTVTLFCTPETESRVQCPVMTTVFDTPLMLTVFWLQTTVRLSLMPETMMFSVIGAVGVIAIDVAGPAAGACVIPLGGAGSCGEALGIGRRVVSPLCDT